MVESSESMETSSRVKNGDGEQFYEKQYHV